MATTSLTSEQEEYLAYIVSSAEQLKHVISDILDFKQLGTELTIEKQPVSIRDCLNEALHQSGILTLSATGNPGVTCHIANDVPDYILSDRGRILQIFVNLIHNSMRFSTRDSWGLDVSITNLGFLPPSPPSTPPSSLSPSSTPPSSINSSSTTPFSSIGPYSSNISSISPNSSISTTSTSSTLPSFSTPVLSTQPLVHIPSLPATTIEPTPISPVSPPEPSSISSSTHSSSETNLPRIPSSSLTHQISPLSAFPVISPSISPSLTTSPSIPKLLFIPPRIIPPPYPYTLPSPTLSPLSVVGQRTNGLRCLLRVTVRDNGKGMEPGALLDVFHPDNSLSRIKHILELLNGDISIESEGTGKGTTATITLKAEIWTPPTSPTPPSPSLLSSLASLSPSSLLLSRHAPPRVRSLPLHSSLSSPSLSSSATLPSSSSSLSPRGAKIFKDLSVLLVEDNLMNQKVLRRLFGKLGIQPDVASHGAQAVEYVRNKKYDIVFMDLHMPVCDGFEATRQIQQLPPHIHKPQIYALTASVSSEDKDKCLSLGMHGHLPKPVSVQALVDALSSVNIS